MHIWNTLRSMVESSWRWAASRNLIRKNPVHGEEEAKLVLEESFEAKNQTGEMMNMTGSAECEDMGFKNYYTSACVHSTLWVK